MTRTVWIDGRRVQLAPAQLLGQGGEAEVYDLGDGRVVKWWKPVDHPDFAGDPDAQAAAAHRLAERPAKLRALPGNLPPEVALPCGLALDRKCAVVGYLMPRVTGEPLCSYGEPRWRREHPVDGNDVIAALLALHAAIERLHRAGVVIGDCNDLNVLVAGRGVHLIDVDSYQFGGFACPMFSERFVDPRLCDAALVPVRPHDAASDWFAFAVMAFRTLLGVSPFGGVSRRCTGAARVLQRISVFAADIVYPRAARPLAILPDELADAFRAVFERDVRTLARDVLERLRLRRCSTCGEEHGRARCPACQTAAMAPPAVVGGRLRWQLIAPSDVALGGYAVTRTTPISLDGAMLYRTTPLGAERIGSVLAGLTRAWVGKRLGVGFYRAGGYAVGFVFRPDRGVLDDRVALPKIRGQLVASHATLGDDRAWLWLTCADAGRLATTCVVIGADAKVLAAETLASAYGSLAASRRTGARHRSLASAYGSLAASRRTGARHRSLAHAPWLAGIAGACAAGPHLFVPTDDGVVRVELVHGALAQTRTFAETAPLVTSGDRLALHATGLDAIRARDAIRMHLT